MLARHEGRQSSMIMAILVIVPQVHAALMAPWPGRQVQSSGRRPLLLIGFVVLPIRALLFALITEPMVLVAVQVLDGISGIMLGVLQPLTIADSIGRTGRFNLAQGFAGAASSIGASLSTTLSGMIVGNFGLAAGFVAVAVIALIAFSVLWALMPETKPADGCYALHSQRLFYSLRASCNGRIGAPSDREPPRGPRPVVAMLMVIRAAMLRSRTNPVGTIRPEVLAHPIREVEVMQCD